MSRRLVPLLYFNIGDAFLFPDGSVARVVGVDPNNYTYDLRGKYLMDIVGMDQDNLRSMLRMGTIKLLKGTYNNENPK